MQTISKLCKYHKMRKLFLCHLTKSSRLCSLSIFIFSKSFLSKPEKLDTNCQKSQETTVPEVIVRLEILMVLMGPHGSYRKYKNTNAQVESDLQKVRWLAGTQSHSSYETNKQKKNHSVIETNLNCFTQQDLSVATWPCNSPASLAPAAPKTNVCSHLVWPSGPYQGLKIESVPMQFSSS
jgi:hypothetical protein